MDVEFCYNCENESVAVFLDCYNIASLSPAYFEGEKALVFARAYPSEAWGWLIFASDFVNENGAQLHRAFNEGYIPHWFPLGLPRGEYVDVFKLSFSDGDLTEAAGELAPVDAVRLQLEGLDWIEEGK